MSFEVYGLAVAPPGRADRRVHDDNTSGVAETPGADGTVVVKLTGCLYPAGAGP
jgi:hypothetical protein